MGTVLLDIAPAKTESGVKANPDTWAYYVLFFLSGFPALLYQIVWQRSLFTLFGVNVESVTVVVAVFMLGLGLGSLIGGCVSNRGGLSLLTAFGIVELSIGLFGSISLWLFHRAATLTAGLSVSTTGIVAFALLAIPTLLMGSTLPLLSEHFVRRTGNVGESVGMLYGVNTCGSGLACLLAAFSIMQMLGETGSVRLAVLINCLVGISAIVLQLRGVSTTGPIRPVSSDGFRKTIPISVAMVLSGTIGFIALAYEILWYRLYSFATGGTARCFAEMLGYYLLGIAYSSSMVRRACKGELRNDLQKTMAAGGEVILVGSIVSFLVGPVLAHWLSLANFITMVPVFISATLLGAAFPLLAHAAIDPAHQVGTGVSRIYLSNIVGSTLGSFVVGFWVLDRFSTRAVSVFLLGLGLAVSVIFLTFAGRKTRRTFFAAECAICLLVLVFAEPLFRGLYERLLYKTKFEPGMKFSDIVENRSGVIAVYRNTTDFQYPTDIVFGGARTMGDSTLI